jgi:RNA-directed DNA polymerase
MKEKVGDLLVPGNVGRWPEVRDRLNQQLRGWSAYFSYGTRGFAYQEIDNYVYDRVRHFLRRRHKVQSRGTSHFSAQVVFGKLGVLRLRQTQRAPCS